MTFRPHERPHNKMCEGVAELCAECKVVFDDNWYKKILEETNNMAEYEEDALHIFSTDKISTTRLSCCVPIEAWMEGMLCAVYPQPFESNSPMFV